MLHVRTSLSLIALVLGSVGCGANEEASARRTSDGPPTANAPAPTEAPAASRREEPVPPPASTIDVASQTEVRLERREHGLRVDRDDGAERRVSLDGPSGHGAGFGTGSPPPGATAPAPPVPEREPEFAAKPREIAVYYGTNRAPLALTIWAYLWLFRWVAGAWIATLLAWSVLRRILRPGLRPWATLLLVVGLGCSIWWSGVELAAALRLREYARRVGRVHSNDFLPLSSWPLETGISTVGFHKDHKPGRIERPDLKDFTVFEDPDRHVMIRSIEPVERDPFFARLRDELRRPGADEAFVFVHGYNTTFEEAVLRTGQIAFDLGFPGVPICFSWASYGGLESYLPDEEHARVSSMHLRLFLEDIVQRARPARLHLVVHSMGSRVAYDALRDVGERSPLRGFHFDEVVLAAPDIGVDEFRASALPRLLGCCGKATLYASDSDVALLASQKVHHVRRAGQAGASLVVDRMMETIDVTGVTKGHSYIGEDDRVIQDLGELIIRHRRAVERPFLEPRTWQPDPSREALPYWVLRKPPR